MEAVRLALGERVREGAEAPASRALSALCRVLCDHREYQADLEEAVAALRTVDAKYELAYVLTRLARLLFDAGDASRARRLAEDGLAQATAIGRASEVARCRVLLARIATAAGDGEAVEAHLEALKETPLRELSVAARGQVEMLLT